MKADELAAKFPPLMVAAARVVSTVAQGVHGRRRVGVGDSFWQYRQFVEGDAASRIDWRRSARSDREYVRDMEWEAAQTVCLWRDGSARMGWRSARELPEKRDRAELLLLALAALLFRAGEQVRLLGGQRVFRGRGAMPAVAGAVAVQGAAMAGARAPAYARCVLFGDFLGDLTELRAALAHFAGQHVRGHLVQVLDPAEIELPYAGRVRFLGLEAEGAALISRVEAVRPAYRHALAERQAELGAIGAASGFDLLLHGTHEPPERALLALYAVVGHRSPNAGGQR